MDHLRRMIEEREDAWLSPHAARSAESEGRVIEEAPDPVRTAFQRDRDRILHSKAFRRLKHKTQVFIDPEGDHYRTRLTHTLEVAQIARTVGRALRLNEDLIEAVALGHDVGHSPFGHAGERALDEELAVIGAGGGPLAFRHYEQSLRIVQVLEPLNLSKETLSGIDGHSKGRKDLSREDGEPVSTLEAAVVRISDRIAYMNHDLDDAVRSGIIPEVPPVFGELGPTHGKRVAAMVMDVIRESLDQPAIRMSAPMLERLNEMKEWLFENVYLEYPRRFPEITKAENMVRALLRHFVQPGNLPEGFRGVQGAVDYVAGMTDRFAVQTFIELTVPAAWRRPF